tara:strand:+ start:1474 stop:2211 length:738 start_codon:yes stop_codon:yes gene_type:complete
MSLSYVYANMEIEKYHSKFNTIQNIIGKDANTIIEIGGHYGEDTLRFHKYFPKSKIYSFEPDPRNIHILRKLCDPIANIEVIEKAVSNTHGEDVPFYQATSPSPTIPTKYKFIDKKDFEEHNLSGSGASSLCRMNEPSTFDLLNSVKIKTVRLDDWVLKKNIPLIDFIWIDVQGHEKNVMEGMIHILPRIKFIQLEYGETIYEGGLSKKETLHMMTKYDFRLVMDYNPNSNTGDFLFENNAFVIS